MAYFLLFDESGVLKTRYDSAVHPDIPAEAVAVDEGLFRQTIRERGGVWMRDAATGNISKQPVPPPCLNHDDVWQAIKALKAEKDAGGIRVEGEEGVFWLNSDALSRMKLMAMLPEVARQPAEASPVVWKTLANDTVTVTPAAAEAISAALFRHDAAVHAAAEVHREAMLALDDPGVYDFSSGWPQTYAEAIAEAKAQEALANAAVPAGVALPDAPLLTQAAAVQVAAASAGGEDDTLKQILGMLQGYLEAKTR